LASNIKIEVIQVLDSFLSLLKKNEERKAHNILFSMLDLRLKTFCLVSSFIGREQEKAIVEKYDKKSSFPTLLKCYYHLHPLIEYEGRVVDEGLKRTNI
jgi:hypothetical protein